MINTAAKKNFLKEMYTLSGNLDDRKNGNWSACSEFSYEHVNINQLKIKDQKHFFCREAPFV